VPQHINANCWPCSTCRTQLQHCNGLALVWPTHCCHQYLVITQQRCRDSSELWTGRAHCPALLVCQPPLLAAITLVLLLGCDLETICCRWYCQLLKLAWLHQHVSMATPIVSRALAGCMLRGSTQHSRRAQGLILITSGGSTPMLRQRTNATAVVLSLSFCRHLDTSPCSWLRDSDASSPAS